MSKKTDIISATKMLLWDIGYEAMSPRKIMNASGAGQGSLYHHFPGKEQLAADVLREVSMEMKQNIDRLFAADIPPIERIENFLLDKRDALKGCPLGRLANEAAIEKPILNEPISDFFAYIQQKIQWSIEEAIEKKEIESSLNPKELAVSLLASLQGGFTLSRIHSDPEYLQLTLKGAISMLNKLKS